MTSARAWLETAADAVAKASPSLPASTCNGFVEDVAARCGYQRRVVDLPSYCERDSFGGEPINTLTNASFWIAAYIGWKRRPSGTRFTRAATWLLVAVGLCSGLWHWFHVRPLLPLDSIPLYALVLLVAYCGVALLVTPRFASGVIATAVGLAIVAHVTTLGTALNTPSRHGAVLVVLAVTVLPLRARGGDAWRWLATGLALYAIALVAKSLDLESCASVPTGLHWIWHALGGVAAGVSVHGVYLLEVSQARRHRA